MNRIGKNESAFTLVEIMIVVAIIGLLASLAIPGFVKNRKQSQGRRAINDCRQLDAAIDQWAMEKGKRDGDPIGPTAQAEAAAYLQGQTWIVNDPVGNPYALGNVGVGQVKISTTTKDALDGVGIDWGFY